MRNQDYELYITVGAIQPSTRKLPEICIVTEVMSYKEFQIEDFNSIRDLTCVQARTNATAFPWHVGFVRR
jgi:hypothetical protein